MRSPGSFLLATQVMICSFLKVCMFIRTCPRQTVPNPFCPAHGELSKFIALSLFTTPLNISPSLLLWFSSQGRKKIFPCARSLAPVLQFPYIFQPYHFASFFFFFISSPCFMLYFPQCVFSLVLVIFSLLISGMVSFLFFPKLC